MFKALMTQGVVAASTTGTPIFAIGSWSGVQLVIWDSHVTTGFVPVVTCIRLTAQFLLAEEALSV